MKLPAFFFLLLLSSWAVLAAHEGRLEGREHKAVNTGKSSVRSKTTLLSSASKTASATKKATASATITPKKKSKPRITKAAKIGIGVGVPLGVLAIVGSVTAYIVGRRRGRKRRVDDPKAGAGGRIRDPSNEVMMAGVSEAPDTGAHRLPKLSADESTKVKTEREEPRGYGFIRGVFGGGGSRRGEKKVTNAPGSPPPQEMPA